MELRSHSVEEVDLQKYWLVIKRRWMPATAVFGLTVALASIYALMQKPLYEAEARLLFKINRAPSLTGLAEDIDEIGSLETLGGNRDNPLDTQAQIVVSDPIIEQTIQELDLRDASGNLMEPRGFANRIKVSPIVGTDILKITFRSGNPEQAAAVVNKLTEVYIESNIQSNRAEAAAAREFIVQQLPRTEMAVKLVESALRQFKEDNQVLVLEQETSAAVQIISGLDNEIAKAEAQLADTDAQLQQLQGEIGINSSQAIMVASLSQAAGVQEVLSQLQEAQTQLEVERTRYRDGHPTIANLERRVAALNDLLRERVIQIAGSDQSAVVLGSLGNLQIGQLQQGLIGDLVRLESQRSGLAQRVETLETTRLNYQERATVLPRLEQTQRELERKLNAAQTTYATLLQRLQEIQVAENQNVGNSRVIAPALIPKNSVGPDKKRIVMVGGILGALLAIAVAFALDLVDRAVKTTKEARELFGYTFLGLIPAYGRYSRNRLPLDSFDALNGRVVVRDLPRSPIAEAYQMLQANLRYLNSDKQIATIVVTSSVAQEGKSEVAANLAAAMAQVGRRVLLVDADMRRSSQHHIWDLTNTVGLSNVIIDQVSLDDAVREVMPNLDVLSAGVMPPNPLALLDSKKMANLISTFAYTYDAVIFDTPPVVNIADAAVLGKMADGVLLVVRPGVVDSASAGAAKEFLTQSGQNVLGLVVNGADVRLEPERYYYQDRSAGDWNATLQPANLLGRVASRERGTVERS